MSTIKPVLVGQGPSASGTGDRPFWGRSGQTLADLIGCSLEEFLTERVEAVNLLTEFRGKQRRGKGDLFPKRAARMAARRLLPSLSGRLVVAAGKGVAEAFGAHPEYFEEQMMRCCLIVTIPHPSGVNRWWNSAGNVRLAHGWLMRLFG